MSHDEEGQREEDALSNALPPEPVLPADLLGADRVVADGSALPPEPVPPEDVPAADRVVAEGSALPPEPVPPGDAPTDRDNVYSCHDPVQRMKGLAEAKEALANSGLVVMPTDTVYGVAADAFDPVGVRRLLRAKGRSRKMPTPVLISSLDTLRALATNLSPETRELAREFWPGALTLICRQQPSLSWDLGDSRSTVALRMPDHEDALALLSDNGPLAVSSANLTGQTAATSIVEAIDMLGDKIDVYLDSGSTPGPVPSTILDATGDTLRVVREGVLSLELLRETVPSIDAPQLD